MESTLFGDLSAAISHYDELRETAARTRTIEAAEAAIAARLAVYGVLRTAGWTPPPDVSETISADQVVVHLGLSAGGDPPSARIAPAAV